VLLSSSPIDPNDLSTGVTFTALDITSRKQAKTALRESEERYGSLFKNNHLVMLLIDPETADIVDANPAACAFYGWSEQEFASKKITDINTLTKEEIFREMEKAKSEKRNHFLFRHRLANREIRDVEVYSGPIKLHGKQLLYSIIHDITEKRRLESQLFQGQKMESIAALAGGIAHQFNNALYAIVGNIELLEYDFAHDVNATAYTDQMKSAIDRMAQLTKQLLAYARGGKYQPEVISLSDFVRDTLPLIEYTLKPYAFLETDLPHEIMNVKADLTQMQMVLSAILTNASESIEGRGRIRITCRNKMITDDMAINFPGLKPGDYVSLKIVDDGKGMDEAIKGRVFEPFFSTKFQGRGLGMAAAYGVVKNHDGWISVDSELDQGTTVRVYLPAVDTAVKALKEPKAEPVKGTGTILYIEDEQIVLDVGQAILERLGYHVLVAKTGKEAIRIAKAFEGKIDLAILDIVLPDMGAKDIYLEITKARPNLKVIVCSGYSIDGPAQEIIDAGANNHL
jgi:PAS domain S-box-containing protein